MKRLLLLFVPLVLSAQVSIDTVIHLPTGHVRGGFYIPELNKLYVTGTDGYIVIDCSTYQVKTQIPARTGLARFAWNRLGRKLYITCNPYPDSTMVVDAVADTIIGWLHVCQEVHELAYLSDVDQLYKPAVETLYAFDGTADSVVRRRTLGGLNTNASWDSADSKLYVGQGDHKLIYVYDYVADSVLKVIDVSAVTAVQPDALLFNNACHKAYVAPFQVEPWDSNVGIVDTERDTLVEVLPVRIWSGLDAQVAVDEKDDKVYLADNDTYVNTPDTLWVVDCATDSILRKVEYAHRGQGAWPIRWVPWSNRLYLVIHQPDTAHYSSIAVLDCGTDSLIVPGMLLNDGYIDDIQLDPIRERIFVIGVDSSDVYVLRDTGYAAVATPKAEVRTASPMPTFVRGVPVLPVSPRPRVSESACLLDACGRKVLDLKSGANDVRALAPGVYFVRQASSARRPASGVTKVVLTE